VLALRLNKMHLHRVRLVAASRLRRLDLDGKGVGRRRTCAVVCIDRCVRRVEWWARAPAAVLRFYHISIQRAAGY
jgi:hypothetical protein